MVNLFNLMAIQVADLFDAKLVMLAIYELS